MTPTLTPKQKWVLDYLKQKAGNFVSPSEIGKAYKRAVGLDRTWYDSSDYSGFGSPLCKALVAKGQAVRNTKGHYQYSGPDLAAACVPSEPTKDKPDLPAGNMSVDQAKTAEDARLAYNAANGYVRVAVLAGGNELYKKKNADGKTWSYFTQRGHVFNTVWNEMHGSKEEFIAIAKDLYQMGYELIVTEVEPTGFKYTIGQVVWYMRDNLVHSAKVLSRDNTNGVTYTTVHGTFAEHRLHPNKESLMNSL